MTTESVKKDAMATTRREFSAVEVSANGSLASEAQAAQARAMVEARFIMAERHPRVWMAVRQNMIKECERPDFALDKSTLYHKPIGEGIEGLGIRFAEMAARAMTNVLTEAVTTFEDDYRRLVKVIVTDLESNTSHSKDCVVVKTTERLTLKEGDVVLSSRTNSRNQIVYTIPASEDALANKEGALISKAMRNGILRLVPGDLQEECERVIRSVRNAKVKEDPDAAIKAVVDGMAKQNVSVGMLEDYLGHTVAQCTPAEIVNLQALYGALRDGEATWRTVMDNLEEMHQMKPKAKAKGADAAKERAAAEQKPAAAPAAKPTEATAKPPQKDQKQAKPPAAAKKAASEAPPWEETAAPASEPVFDDDEPEQAPAPAPAPAPKPAPAKAVAKTEEAPASPGRVIKDVQFPANMRRTSPEDGWTQEQYDEANTTIKKLGEHFTIEDTVTQMFGMDVTEMSGVAFDALAQVLAKMVDSRQKG